MVARSGVTVAETNLKLVWDVIKAVKVGETGYAYIVDGNGRLIADRDEPWYCAGLTCPLCLRSRPRWLVRPPTSRSRARHSAQAAPRRQCRQSAPSFLRWGGVCLSIYLRLKHVHLSGVLSFVAPSCWCSASSQHILPLQLHHGPSRPHGPPQLNCLELVGPILTLHGVPHGQLEVTMEPGLLVELSSSERATLRHVAFGIAETNLPDRER